MYKCLNEGLTRKAFYDFRYNEWILGVVGIIEK